MISKTFNALLNAADTLSKLCFTLLIIPCAAICNESPPNVLLIVVDDLGWADVGYNDRNNVFQTPNIDELASKSMVFTDAYAGASNCAPSRAVLMSGQYTPRHGIYTVSPSDRGHPKTRRLIATKNTDILGDSVVTLAELFKSQGYTTGSFGKWHLGQDAKSQGFDHNVAGHLKGHPKSYFSPYNMPFLEDGPKGEYLPNRITTEAIDWISEVRDQPFFAYVPYYTVHTPLETIDTFKQKYLSHPKVRNERHATYAAMVELMDINIGRLITSLKEFNISNDTLIIFTSDNGGIRSISYQDPLRGGKGSYYEGGTRVPLLIHWQNKIPAKEVNIPVINADFFPTLASVLGKVEFSYPLDGIDLSPLLLSNLSIEERSLFWHFPIYLQSYNPSADQSRDPLFRTRPGSAMRKGKWKLHHYFEDDSYELYDLENDEGEHVNLAQYLPKIVQALSAELQHWRDSINAPIPKTVNPQFDEVFSAELTEKHLSKK